MRRKRESKWQYALVALGVGAIVFGLQYTIRKKFFNSADPDLAFVLKPSYFHSASDRGSLKKKTSTAALKPSQEAKKEDRRPASSRQSTPSLGSEGVKEVFHPRRAVSVSSNSVCTSVEIPGRGPERAGVSEEDWDKTLNLFREAKASLKKWLEKNRSDFEPQTYTVMEQQLDSLVIQRPPFLGEPDLAWRGILVLYTAHLPRPIIRMGDGFVRLAVEDPQRARFEFARTSAQLWSPCELQRLSQSEGTSVNPWTPLLSCLGIRGQASCAPGSYSETGWAMSSALAVKVVPPGCEIPAFQGATYERCISDIPMKTQVSRYWKGLGF